MVGIVGGYARLDSEISIEEAGRGLITLCRRGWLAHRFEGVEHAARVVLGLAALRPEISNVAKCYYASCLAQRGEGQQAVDILNRVVDRVDREFRPRATLALAKVHYDDGRLGASVPIYVEAARVAKGSDPLAEVQALRMLAIVRSIDGDHNGALADLERLLPSMRRLAAHYPPDYYHYLNSLAIELGEVGRIEEASRAIEIVLASSLAPRVPQWLDTKEELATKPRRVFTPFTMALGPRATRVAVSDESKDPLPSSDVAAIRSPEAAANRSQLVQPAPRIRHKSLCFVASRQIRATGNNTRQVRNERFLATGRSRPRSLSGYAISPPSRAPPAL
ncbi:MAG TPA: tetratricopeptide repeat protein [Blastocatellia bacterium]|nr:tetratricopeptide repeat protein [Blastocatellia bacterium]